MFAMRKKLNTLGALSSLLAVIGIFCVFTAVLFITTGSEEEGKAQERVDIKRAAGREVEREEEGRGKRKRQSIVEIEVVGVVEENVGGETVQRTVKKYLYLV